MYRWDSQSRTGKLLTHCVKESLDDIIRQYGELSPAVLAPLLAIQIRYNFYLQSKPTKKYYYLMLEGDTGLYRPTAKKIKKP